MKPTNYFFLFLFLFATACGSKKSTDDNTPSDTSEVAVDSVKIEITEEMQELLAKFKPLNEFPLVVDSAFIANALENDSLKSKHIHQLAANWFDHDLCQQHMFDIDNFYTIDSIKDAGKYAKYVRDLDIGMTKNSMTYAVGQMNLDEKTILLVWALSYGSYEACPYSSGTSIYFSIVVDGVVKESFILGEDMGAGDPPVSMERRITSKLDKDGKLALEVWEESTDGDEEIITEIIKEHYKFEIKEGQIKLISEKKDKPKVITKKAEE